MGRPNEQNLIMIESSPTLTGTDSTHGMSAIDSAASYQMKYTAGASDSNTTYTVVTDSHTQTLTNKSLTTPTITGDGGAGFVRALTAKFDATDGHDSAVGTSTGTIEVPAGSVILDIQVSNVVLWDAGTSTTMIVGDDDDPNGWFTGINLQATDLVVGEILSALHGDLWGGKEGAYIVAATGRRGRLTAGVDSGNYVGAATEVIGSVTTVGTVPTVGTTYMTVFYTTPTEVAAVYAAT